MTQETGAQWIDEGVYPVLSVPSTIIPEERNFVINPAHPEYGAIRFQKPQPFRFDPRLAGKTVG